MFRKLPAVTRLILITNVVIFFLQSMTSMRLLTSFALWPVGPLFAPWQVVSYGFLHGGLTHLLFNMLALYMFGGALEQVWGGRRFGIYYLVCIVSAAATQLVVTAAMDSQYPTVGASGGVFGLLLAFALYFPRQKILLLIPPIPLPAWLFVTLYGAIELYLGVTGSQAGVAHFAHLGGMLGGYLLIQSWRTRPPLRRQ